jgi:hypothetical protein
MIHMHSVNRIVEPSDMQVSAYLLPLITFWVALNLYNLFCGDRSDVTTSVSDMTLSETCSQQHEETGDGCSRDTERGSTSRNCDITSISLFKTRRVTPAERRARQCMKRVPKRKTINNKMVVQRLRTAERDGCPPAPRLCSVIILTIDNSAERYSDERQQHHNFVGIVTCTSAAQLQNSASAPRCQHQGSESGHLE